MADCVGLSVLHRVVCRFVRVARELLFPPACLICHAALPGMDDLHICPGCLGKVVMVEPPFCRCCGQTFPSAAGGNHLCSTCLTTPYYFQKARALISYNEPAATLIHSFKYGGRTTAFSTFKALWRQSGMEQEIGQSDLIIPVPLHLSRLRQRGFNQAQLLAEIFFAGQKAKIKANILRRMENTSHQTTLSGKARRLNLKNAFAVFDKEEVSGKKIVLVDDVFTTGATLNECAKVLVQAGAREVEVVTLARSFQTP